MDEQPLKQNPDLIAPQVALPCAGEAGHQFGLPHIKAACAKCHAPFAVSGPGQFVCRNCGTLLEVTEAAK